MSSTVEGICSFFKQFLLSNFQVPKEPAASTAEGIMRNQHIFSVSPIFESDGDLHLSASYEGIPRWCIVCHLETDEEIQAREAWNIQHSRKNIGALPVVPEEDVEDIEIATNQNNRFTTTPLDEIAGNVSFSSVPVNDVPSGHRGCPSKRPLPSSNLFYNLAYLREVMLRDELAETTQLNCFARICHCQVDREVSPVSGLPRGLTWVIKEADTGAHVEVAPSAQGSDKIFMLIKSKRVRLSGRKKQRLLDDLARIQVMYATITSPNLLTPTGTCRDNGMFSANLQEPDFDIVNADTTPMGPSTEAYALHLLETTGLGKFSDFINSLRLLAGSYPLSPPMPIWRHISIDPQTGKITQLRYGDGTQTVPWEVAFCHPFRLSKRSRERYRHSLKRHLFGRLVRFRDENNKFGEQTNVGLG